MFGIECRTFCMPSRFCTTDLWPFPQGCGRHCVRNWKDEAEERNVPVVALERAVLSQGQVAKIFFSCKGGLGHLVRPQNPSGSWKETVMDGCGIPLYRPSIWVRHWDNIRDIIFLETSVPSAKNCYDSGLTMLYIIGSFYWLLAMNHESCTLKCAKNVGLAQECSSQCKCPKHLWVSRLRSFGLQISYILFPHRATGTTLDNQFDLEQ